MQFSIKTKLKRIVSATLASLLMLTSTPMVSAANGWDEAEHKRWVTCTTCGGAGSYKTACPPTVSTACYRCPDMSKKQGARGFIFVQVARVTIVGTNLPHAGSIIHRSIGHAAILL